MIDRSAMARHTDDQHGRISEAFRKGLRHQPVGLLVEGRCGLVADDNLAPFKDSSSHADELLFAGRQILRIHHLISLAL